MAKLKVTTKLITFFSFLLIIGSVYCQESGLWVGFKSNLTYEYDTSSNSINSNNEILNDLISKYSISSISRPLLSSKKEKLINTIEIKCTCDIEKLKLAIEKSGIAERIDYAPIITPLYTPNDLTTQATFNYGLNLINAELAWDITHGDSAIEIAIIDVNFNINHEELLNKWTYFDSTNLNSNYAHGTCVAIIAGGNTDNNLGVSSIGFKSKLQLRPMNYNQVLEASYSGAKVLNLSWTSGCYNNQFTQDVIDEVYENGTTVIAAAGNGVTCGSPSNLVYPAAHNHVISVTSIGPSNNHERIIGDINSTHQHNSTVDLSAPGYDVLVSSTSGNYVTANGTSFAAPFVSGVVALMLSVNPCLNPDQIEYILKESSYNIDQSNPAYIGLIGVGRVDAFAAVQMAQNFSTLPINVESVFDCSAAVSKLILDTSLLELPLEISWNTNDTSFMIENILPGNFYSVHVTDNSGCFGNYNIISDTLTPLMMNSNVQNNNCSGQNIGAIEVTVNGGTGAYSFSWDSIPFNSLTLNNLFSGNYNLHLEDEFNCILDTNLTVTEPIPLTINLNYSENEYLQYGEIFAQALGGTCPYTYSWNNGVEGNRCIINYSDFYEVEVLDSKGCEISANILINQLNNSEEFVINENDDSVIINQIKSNPIAIYPNPIQKGNSFTINYKINDFTVSDLNGRDCSHFFQNVSSMFNYDSDIEIGVYFIKVTIDKHNYTFKIEIL